MRYPINFHKSPPGASKNRKIPVPFQNAAHNFIDMVSWPIVGISNAAVLFSWLWLSSFCLCAFPTLNWFLNVIKIKLADSMKGLFYWRFKFSPMRLVYLWPNPAAFSGLSSLPYSARGREAQPHSLLEMQPFLYVFDETLNLYGPARHLTCQKMPCDCAVTAINSVKNLLETVWKFLVDSLTQHNFWTH